MPTSICLVSMPWHAIESPSLPIGLLTASCVGAGLDPPAVYHGSLHWLEYLMAASGGELTPGDYNEIAETGLFDGLGDWVFTGVLHDDAEFGVERLKEYAAERGIDIDVVARMRELADDFVTLATESILALGPDIVGFSTTFMQNVPSLAVARRLKRIRPGIVTVFGGGNCDGPMGAALHRTFDCVDYVVRGEGEVSFPALLKALSGAGNLADVPGLCWWDGASQRCNAQAAPLPQGRIPVPDFDEWFARIDGSPVLEHVEPKLIFEAARGCWWGQAHHCTFCGLNGTLMEFRSKPAEAVVADLARLVERHQVLDVIMVDNIIDYRYFTTMLPRLADYGWDLRVHYEVKSNLKPAEIAALAAARVTHVQPGIESLVSPVLSIMDKGVTGIRNVRTLRDCESAGLTVSWNWLFGFPGETLAQYRPIVEQLPALVHLQPPSSAARVLLERFSPYFERPELGFPRRVPAEAYRHVYTPGELGDGSLVYLFDTDPCGLSDTEVTDLRDAVTLWSDRYADSTLSRLDQGAEIVIQDRRAGWPSGDHRITDPVLVAAYRELEPGRSMTALRERLAAAGHRVDAATLAAWADDLARRGLVFRADDQLIALATDAGPVKVGDR